ncbi:putative repeat protein (TIGR03809 family) [Bradyrhizobium japonicum]|uniref:TIGR03809 family protein n=1 Tax=Bradyrhizobium japonicum TaxID=375 RepID=UPI00348EE2BD|nr:putative repeat protein (TIGR03809 family) [Bradyrhizobium japonicum]MCS3966119.1 putative repeat protein (TIGR03809 family) [Bradyrhizobium japonicum]MCS3998426.1 putative repeat protein (TIGR03809 family) [Bradyrhizobium japonicum]
MTHRQEAIRDVARGRDIAARWCALAEQRLEHLSEMFETGRWRRYHSEIAFLENIQEAKRAVQTWRALATGGDVAAAAASVSPAFGWSPATMSRVLPRDQQAQTVQPKTLQPKAVHIAAETAVPVRLAPTPEVLAEITEAPLAPRATPAAVALFTAPAAVAPLKAPAARAPLTAPAVRSPVAPPAAMAEFTAPAVKAPPAVPAAMATLLPQFAPPAAEIVAAPERVVEFTFSLDGLQAKYPLLRNAF